MAFSEPSIGIDDHAHRAAAEVDLAALLGDGDEAVAGGVKLVEEGEDHVLGAPVDHEREVAALAAAGLDRALERRRVLAQDTAQALGRAPAERQPVRRQRVR